MARIPLGDYGGVIARPVERPTGDAEAYGAGVGRAITTAGQIGMNAAGQEIAHANAEAKHASDTAKRQAEADARQLAREQAAEDKHLAAEARRTKTVNATGEVTVGLRQLHMDIEAGLEDGTIDKGAAGEQFRTRSKKLVEKAMGQVDPEHRDAAMSKINDDVGLFDISVQKLVRARDKHDIRAGGLQYFETMQRYAAGGPAEADRAIENVRAFWTATGPMAGEAPDVASSRVQQFAEKVRFNQANALLDADPAATLKALKNPKYLPELDPGARTNLIANAEIRITQAAHRAEIANQAAQRRLDASWSAVKDVAAAGKSLTPAFMEQKRREFRGTIYAPALEQLMAEGPALTSFAAQPLEKQAAELLTLQTRMNSGGATPDDIKDFNRKVTAHRANQKAIAGDPYMAYAEVGGIKAGDLETLSMDPLTLPAQLAKRRELAGRVSAWTGQEVSLLRPAEAEKAHAILNAMPLRDKAGTLNAIAAVMTPGQRRAFAAQLDGGKDRGLALAMRFVGEREPQATNFFGTAVGSPRLIPEMLIEGQQASQDGTSTKNPMKGGQAVEPGGWKAYAADALAGVFPNQQDANDAADAAELLMHSMAAKAGGRLKKTDMEAAVNLAVGGTLVEHNGRKIPLPPGMDRDELDKRLSTVTPAGVNALGGFVIAGGVKTPLSDFLQTLPASQLMPVRRGVYAPLVGGRPVLNSAGKAVVIDVTR